MRHRIDFMRFLPTIAIIGIFVLLPLFIQTRRKTSAFMPGI